MTDPLTGLANRRQVAHWLPALIAEASRRGSPLSCLMVDLDHFKAINDRFGHRAGDVALRSAAGAIAGAVRASDRVARYGGEEFLVLMPATDRAGALIVAERVRSRVAGQSLSPPGPGGGEAVPGPLTASVGLAERRPGEPADRLIDRADAALACAKAAGRDRVEVDT
jgi:diguanylate cyclase (GGDEF)-like protein